MVRVPRSVPRVAVIHVAPRPTTVASISASKVTNTSRTLFLARSGWSRRVVGQCRSKAVGKLGGGRGNGSCRFRRVARRLGRVVEQLLHAHQDVRATFGQNWRWLDIRRLRGAIGG